ncbi:AAA family ATPase [Fodinisporobacter ferrooxydans]|uniref:AAA family ATPase n=1 Tax=Fodinisporobacter ferrooxydans TaxID=2901836 RepID=A0ABY4CLT1_9BACL|nr:AAA family ATPase [Alicyclobacillaceae bacterium MYW30-H2]
MKYEYRFVPEKNKYEESRSFLDQNGKKIQGKNTTVRKEHLSFFPYFYMETLRDVKREIHNKSSFWGKLKDSLDYSAKEPEIRAITDQLNELLLADNRLGELVERLKQIENSIKISQDSDNIYLQAFSKRSWELLDGLRVYLKSANSNISLPIEKHGMGTQNIAILVIFNAFLEILLPETIENPETTPIIGIEEPEAHVYPHSQRAIFEQLSKIQGQKLISTHSPFIVDNADIYDYIMFRNVNGITEVKQISEYNMGWKFKYGLPQRAYDSNRLFKKEELHSLRRYVQFKNTELLFSTLFLMCEGDTEKIFFEMIAPHYLKKPLGAYGISIISCDGKAYSNFLKIVRKEVLDIPWLIFSDGEEDTKEDVRKAVFTNAYSGEEFDDNVIFLPSGMDFEAYCIDWLGVEVIQNIISDKYGSKTLDQYRKKLEQELNSKHAKNLSRNYFDVQVDQEIPLSVEDYSDTEIINKWVDSQGKTFFSEYVAEHMIENQLPLPREFQLLFDKIAEKLKGR